MLKGKGGEARGSSNMSAAVMSAAAMVIVMGPVEEVRDIYGEELHCFGVLYPSLHELTVFDGV
jgi:hypothetical protein